MQVLKSMQDELTRFITMPSRCWVDLVDKKVSYAIILTLCVTSVCVTSVYVCDECVCVCT